MYIGTDVRVSKPCHREAKRFTRGAKKSLSAVSDRESGYLSIVREYAPEQVNNSRSPGERWAAAARNRLGVRVPLTTARKKYALIEEQDRRARMHRCTRARVALHV